jgi:hypothetical protein
LEPIKASLILLFGIKWFGQLLATAPIVKIAMPYPTDLLKHVGKCTNTESHQAVDAVRLALHRAHPYVLDANLQQYSDTIVHRRQLLAANSAL